MNQNTIEKNRLLAQTVIKGLASRNMTGYYAESKEEALQQALALIPEGSRIARGGSFTVNEIGLTEALMQGNYEFCNREVEPDKRAAELFAYTSDVYIGSTNAMTEDGILINIDGNSNRVSSYAYGPKKLILVVGMNKIAKDVDAAMKRARNVAAPANMTRFAGRNTPCTKTGTCMNCKSPDTICCQILITRYSMHKDRIHVILVNEELGF
ncbi:MAG: lactate utilization protein [Lachnospiraceae bacterium]|nr:lactate utilization protein [Lachnospiraceae bacterium]